MWSTVFHWDSTQLFPILLRIVAHCGPIVPHIALCGDCGTLFGTSWWSVLFHISANRISKERKEQCCLGLSSIVRHKLVISSISHLYQRERERERAMLSSIIVSHELVIFLISAVSDCPQLFPTGSRDRGQSKSGVKESSFWVKKSQWKR